MADFDIKRNDRMPYIRMVLGYDDGSGANLSVATSIRFLMRDCKTGRLKVDGVATVVDAAAGIVEYQWAEGDTDTAGRFDTEWEILWATGLKQSFPGEGYGTVNVLPDLG